MAKPVTDRKASPIDRHVGAQVRRRRLELRMSQAELADRIGLTFQQLFKYEHGAARIAAGRLFDLANALDVEPGWFFQGLAAVKGRGTATVTDITMPAATYPDVVEAAQALLRIEDRKVRYQLMKMITLLAGDTAPGTKG